MVALAKLVQRDCDTGNWTEAGTAALEDLVKGMLPFARDILRRLAPTAVEPVHALQSDVQMFILLGKGLQLSRYLQYLSRRPDASMRQYFFGGRYNNFAAHLRQSLARGSYDGYDVAAARAAETMKKTVWRMLKKGELLEYWPVGEQRWRRQDLCPVVPTGPLTKLAGALPYAHRRFLPCLPGTAPIKDEYVIAEEERREEQRLRETRNRIEPLPPKKLIHEIFAALEWLFPLSGPTLLQLASHSHQSQPWDDALGVIDVGDDSDPSGKAYVSPDGGREEKE